MNLAALQTSLARHLTGTAAAGTTAPPADPQRLALAAYMLLRKRLDEAAPALPRTRRALGARFSELFLAHAAIHRPRGTPHPAEDAHDFAVALSADRSSPSWLRELAAYEAAWLRARRARPLLLALRCAHRVDRPCGREGPERRALLAVWWRLGRNAPLHHLSLPWW